MEHKHEPDCSGWELLWKLKVQQRVKEFIWLVAHDMIPTNLARWQRSMIMNPSSMVCNSRWEDSLQAPRDCSAANKVWAQLVPPRFLQKFYSLPLKEWIYWNLSKTPRFSTSSLAWSISAHPDIIEFHDTKSLRAISSNTLRASLSSLHLNTWKSTNGHCTCPNTNPTWRLTYEQLDRCTQRSEANDGFE